MAQIVVPVFFADPFSLTGYLDGRMVVVAARDGLMYIDEDVAERARTPRPGPDTYPVDAVVGETMVGTVLAIMRSIDSTVKVVTSSARADELTTVGSS